MSSLFINEEEEKEEEGKVEGRQNSCLKNRSKAREYHQGYVWLTGSVKSMSSSTKWRWWESEERWQEERIAEAKWAV